MPGPLGAHNWQPMSYSPQTGLVYIPALEAGFGFAPVESKLRAAARPVELRRRSGRRGHPRGRGHPQGDPRGDQGPADRLGSGARKPAWTVEYPVPWNGGLLSTAGGLLFQGTGTGRFVAYEAATGKKLWEFHAQTGIIAAPVTYEVDGEQYVTVLAGWGGAAPNAAGEIVMEAAKGVQPHPHLQARRQGRIAAAEDRRAQARSAGRDRAAGKVAAGRSLYQTYCMICHGDTAVSGGVVPDLRYRRRSVGRRLEIDRARGLDGQNGMVPFGHLKPDDVETIRPTSSSARMTSRSGSPIRKSHQRCKRGGLLHRSVARPRGPRSVAAALPAMRRWNFATLRGVNSIRLART